MTTASSGVIVDARPARDGRPGVKYRVAGDRFLLVEYGDMVLDLTMNFRVFGLSDLLSRVPIPGVVETVPAVRSMLVRYDGRRLTPRRLVDALLALEDELPAVGNLVIPSRRVTLPIAFVDRWTRADIERYVKFIRQDAPNVVDGHNAEYIARYNGLRDVEEMIATVCATEWWNACIGFWPGLPFMFPLDPRRAIVVPKYNPTRPWTAEGAVGIGGPCVAIYPVASPGGYQLFGRTVPIYDLERRNPGFRDNPILLRPGDRITWERVDEHELEARRAALMEGGAAYAIVDDPFDVRTYVRFLEETRLEADAFRRRQEAAQRQVAVP
jgi:allophanate hydrolase subunit 1